MHATYAKLKNINEAYFTFVLKVDGVMSMGDGDSEGEGGEYDPDVADFSWLFTDFDIADNGFVGDFNFPSRGSYGYGDGNYALCGDSHTKTHYRISLEEK